MHCLAYFLSPLMAALNASTNSASVVSERKSEGLCWIISNDFSNADAFRGILENSMAAGVNSGKDSSSEASES